MAIQIAVKKPTPTTVEGAVITDGKFTNAIVGAVELKATLDRILSLKNTEDMPNEFTIIIEITPSA